jgi:glycosyltransferase involved in cell wall biosynthesis
MDGVSVVIPAFRAEATIVRAVASALSQNPAEIIVVSDDGVDYVPVLARAGLRDNCLRHTTTGRIGAGPAIARNVGQAMATGEIVAWLDADDLFHPGRLAALAPLARERGAAADNVRVVDDATGRELQCLFPPGDGVMEMDAEGFLATSVPMMFAVRRSLGLRWDEDLLLGDDVAYNLRLFDRLGPLPVTLRPFHDYRVRPGSICHADDSAAKAEEGYGVMLRRLAGDGFGFTRPEIRAAFAVSLRRKIALNRAFDAAHRAGHAATFQEFIAARRET